MCISGIHYTHKIQGNSKINVINKICSRYYVYGLDCADRFHCALSLIYAPSSIVSRPNIASNSCYTILVLLNRLAFPGLLIHANCSGSNAQILDKLEHLFSLAPPPSLPRNGRGNRLLSHSLVASIQVLICGVPMWYAKASSFAYTS